MRLAVTVAEPLPRPRHGMPHERQGEQESDEPGDKTTAPRKGGLAYCRIAGVLNSAYNRSPYAPINTKRGGLKGRNPDAVPGSERRETYHVVQRNLEQASTPRNSVR